MVVEFGASTVEARAGAAKDTTAAGGKGRLPATERELSEEEASRTDSGKTVAQSLVSEARFAGSGQHARLTYRGANQRTARPGGTRWGGWGVLLGLGLGR